MTKEHVRMLRMEVGKLLFKLRTTHKVDWKLDGLIVNHGPYLDKETETITKAYAKLSEIDVDLLLLGKTLNNKEK